jgi:hypothetical protein
MTGFLDLSNIWFPKNTRVHDVSETGSVSETLCSVEFLEYRKLDKFQKSSNSDCNTPLPEAFIIYNILPFPKIRMDNLLKKAANLVQRKICKECLLNILCNFLIIL